MQAPTNTPPSMTIPAISLAPILGEPMSILPSRMTCKIAVKTAPIADVIVHIVNGAGKLANVAACSTV
uniref:Uncharacterized protein n=1 Tax=Arundo donax TaxID=35708 RepID=A0A0A8ZKH6_ARUDO